MGIAVGAGRLGRYAGWCPAAAPVRSDGDSPFARLLGARWLFLPPAVRRRFLRKIGEGACVTYVGEVAECRISRAGWLLAQLARLVGAPLPLGADVPFFLRGRNAWVEGVGERITPIDLPAARFAVVKPPRGLATRDIFGNPALKRDSDSATISGFAANPFGFGHNDLEPVARRICPDVEQALQWLGSQGLRGRMTGSGSAVFALLPPGQHPVQAPAGWVVKECGSLEVHPLVGWAPSDDSV